MQVPSTIPGLLAELARSHPARAALGAPDRGPLDFHSLHGEVQRLTQALRAAGVERKDRVMVVLPNGALMATAFLGTAATAICAPLNPTYGEREVELACHDLRPRALVALARDEGAAVQVARRRGIRMVGLVEDARDRAGAFRLPAGVPPADPRSATTPDPQAATPGDVALILHTSGTTARPKQVPLTHANLLASARSIAATLELSAADLCLNVMPLFHIHGLVGAVLSSLTAGSGVWCTPGFLSPRTPEWLAGSGATWLTAVPTMYQSMLGVLRATASPRPPHRLRLLRSSSAALPPAVLAELERVFEVPVIESYGMTEAAHQMASNRMPPATRRAGTVGQAAGPEIAILDDAGRPQSPGTIGEVAIRGPSVMAGYLDNPQANAEAFAGDWFRTGDLGQLAPDGTLTLTGRKKEQINRGGEKIAPREIDEILLEHPAVAQAIAFAVPHPQLGEDLAAAVVLRPSAAVTEFELRTHVARRLAHFKVPARILFLEEIPKGATGKVQRIGLAARLGVEAMPAAAPEPRGDRPGAAPRTELERYLLAQWEAVLKRPGIGLHDPFLAVGGDSMLAMQLVSQLALDLQVELPLIEFFDAATVAEQAALIGPRLGPAQAAR